MNKVMKANELMVGDWVNLSKGNWSENRQVELIDIEMIGESVYFAAPILLTPEILEKNGVKWFCTEPSGRKTYCCNEPVVQCTYIPNSGWLINVGACGSIKVRFVEISKVQYVHELQHALRLCGIDKTIEL